MQALLLDRFADFPVMSEGIDDSSYTPTILVCDGPNHGGSRRDGTCEGRIRVFHDHHHPDRAASEGLGAEVQVLRGLVGDPEFGFTDRELSDHRSVLAI